MSKHEQLLKALKARKQRKSLVGHGITTADRYVRTVSDCVGSDECERLYSEAFKNLPETLKESAAKLVYCNPDMVLEESANLKTNSSDFKSLLIEKADEETPELPPNTLMVFRHVLTTPRKDRDGDVLRTNGAQVDPKMVLLWQHIHTLPIGKLLQVVEHSSSVLRNVSALIDMNELAHDSAVMLENGMGRFSHGFRALEWEQLKESEGDTTGPAGFDIKVFEIMEESLVSVPSNIDAETEEVLMTLAGSKRLKSDLVHRFIAQRIKQHRNVSTPGVDMPNGTQLSLKLGGMELELTKFGDDEIETKTVTKTKTASCSCDDPDSCDCGKQTKPKEKDAPADPPEDKTGEPDGEKRLEPGSIEGSWEWTAKSLRQNAAGFMQNSGAVSDMANRFVWIVGTFPDNAIICTEHERSMVPDEFVYFKVAWELKDGIPRFTGEPTPIEVQITLEEQRDASPYAVKSDGTKFEKVGRALSRANITKLQEVKEGLAELKGRDGMDRAGKALCTECMNKLDEVIGSPSDDSDDERQVDADSVKQAIDSLFELEDKDLFAHKGALDALLGFAERYERRQKFRKFKGK